jgi:hypothetical protein
MDSLPLVGKPSYHRQLRYFFCGRVGEEGVVTFGDELYGVFSEVAATKLEVLKQKWSAPEILPETCVTKASIRSASYWISRMNTTLHS